MVDEWTIIGWGVAAPVTLLKPPMIRRVIPLIVLRYMRGTLKYGVYSVLHPLHNRL